MGTCCAMGCSCWLVFSCGWGFVVLTFVVMDREMGNCFSIKKAKQLLSVLNDLLDYVHEPQTKRTQLNAPWASLTHHDVTPVLHQIGSTKQGWGFTTHAVWGEKVSFCPSTEFWFAENKPCSFTVEGELLSMGILFYGCNGWMSWRIKTMKKSLAQRTVVEDVYHMIWVSCIQHDISWHDVFQEECSEKLG